MNSLRDILIKPIVTEKSMTLFNEDNKYTFKVAKTANKFEIKDAVQKIFKVRVLSVTTMNVRGKVTRRGRFVGRTSDWKKAIVTIHKDDTIELNGAPLFES